MNNSAQTPDLEKLNTDSMFDRIFHKTQMLANHKDELLGILNTFESATRVISKIQHESVITQTEHRLLKKFIEDGGLRTDICTIPHDIYSSNDQEGTLYHLSNFTQVVEKYPYVVNANEVCNIHSTGLGGFIEIQKNGKVGIIRKGVDDVIYALAPDQYEGILSTDYKDFEKYGVLEIKNPISEGPGINIKSTDTVFLKVHMIGDIISGSLIELGNFNLVTNFDKDNIAIAVKDNHKYCFIHKDFLDRDTTEIYQLGPSFRSDRDSVKNGFDKYNSFIAKEGRIYKKRYNKTGDFNGIDVSRKSFMGKETILGEFSTRRT